MMKCGHRLDILIPVLSVVALSLFPVVEACNIPFVGDVYGLLFKKKCGDVDGPSSAPTPSSCEVARVYCNPVDVRDPDDVQVTVTDSIAYFNFPDLYQFLDDAGPLAVFLEPLIRDFAPVKYTAGTFSDKCRSDNQEQTGFHAVSPDGTGGATTATVTIEFDSAGGFPNNPILLLGFDTSNSTSPSFSITTTTNETDICVIDGGTRLDDDADTTAEVELDVNSASQVAVSTETGLLLSTLGLGDDNTFTGGLNLDAFVNGDIRGAVIAIVGNEVSEFSFTSDGLLFFSVAYNG